MCVWQYIKILRTLYPYALENREKCLGLFSPPSSLIFGVMGVFLLLYKFFIGVSNSSVLAGEEDVHIFHWYVSTFISGLYGLICGLYIWKSVWEFWQQWLFLLPILHLMYWFCGFVCICKIWRFFKNQIDWFFVDKRWESFEMVIRIIITQWLFYQW